MNARWRDDVTAVTANIDSRSDLADTATDRCRGPEPECRPLPVIEISVGGNGSCSDFIVACRGTKFAIGVEYEDAGC